MLSVAWCAGSHGCTGSSSAPPAGSTSTPTCASRPATLQARAVDASQRDVRVQPSHPARMLATATLVSAIVSGWSGQPEWPGRHAQASRDERDQPEQAQPRSGPEQGQARAAG